MTIVTIHKAKTTLSQLIKRAEAGEVIEIARGTKVVAKLVPQVPEAKKKNMGRGAWKGQVVIHPSFYDDMTPEELLLCRDGQIEPPR
jgi:antitoxin (DNA-binding transcriptional repressor) of toxin-antitoxin stability system